MCESCALVLWIYTRYDSQCLMKFFFSVVSEEMAQKCRHAKHEREKKKKKRYILSSPGEQLAACFSVCFLHIPSPSVCRWVRWRWRRTIGIFLYYGIIFFITYCFSVRAMLYSNILYLFPSLTIACSHAVSFIQHTLYSHRVHSIVCQPILFYCEILKLLFCYWTL